MVLDTNSSQAEVQDFFGKPIHNDSALKCYGDVENADYSGFDTNLYKYLNEKSISEMIKVNSEIGRILKKFKISVKINMKILNNLVRNHLPQTKNIALGIAKHLPEDLQIDVNKKALSKATCLHDLAKVIIPENIINKKGSLNTVERQIMQEHAALSYEMLKTTDLDEETLNLIKNHHHNPIKATTPQIGNTIENINLQILSMADIYSALREKRSYKDKMSKEQALEIIRIEVEKGKFHLSVFNALVEYTKYDENLSNGNSKGQIFNFKPVNSFSA